MTKNKVSFLEAEVALAKYFNPRQNLIVPNVSWGLRIHECDVLICSQQGYLTEIEIKMSKQDLIKDKDKRHGHNDYRIKKLYFAIPDFLYNDLSVSVEIQHIPERAGIITFFRNDYQSVCIEIVRDAVVNNNVKPISVEEKYNLARLGTMRIWNLKKTICGLRSKKMDNVIGDGSGGSGDG